MAIKADKDTKSSKKNTAVENPAPKASPKSKKQLDEDDDEDDDVKPCLLYTSPSPRD